MGLFSFTSKNKQESATEDSGHYLCAAEQASTAQARSKRASGGSKAGAGRSPGPVDPVLPEKKRARRRLVGAIALALAVAVGLPMILDAEQKPLASDIAIQIPSRDQAPAAPVTQAAPAGASKVDASAALDQSEEIVPPAPLPKAAPAAAPAVPPVDSVPVPSVPVPSVPVPLLKAPRAEVKKIDAPKADIRHEARAADTRAADNRGGDTRAADNRAGDTRAADNRAGDKKAGDTRNAPKASEKTPAAVKPVPVGADAARAQDILEGKPPANAHEAAGAKFVLQVAALASQEKVDELQARLRQAGIRSYTQKMSNVAATRVRLGPFASKEEADRMRAKLKQIGLDGFLVPF